MGGEGERRRGFGREQLGKLHDVEVEEMPRVHVTRNHAIAFGLFVVSALAFLYFVLPKLTGLRATWDKLDQGDPIWLVVAALLELLLVRRLHDALPRGLRPRRFADRLA